MPVRKSSKAGTKIKCVIYRDPSSLGSPIWATNSISIRYTKNASAVTILIDLLEYLVSVSPHLIPNANNRNPVKTPFLAETKNFM